MFKRKLLKQSKLRRLLLKILNVHAIDKETFNLVNPHTNNEGDNFFVAASYVGSTFESIDMKYVNYLP